MRPAGETIPPSEYLSPPCRIPWAFAVCPLPSLRLSTSSTRRPRRRSSSRSHNPAQPPPKISTSASRLARAASMLGRCGSCQWGAGRLGAIRRPQRAAAILPDSPRATPYQCGSVVSRRAGTIGRRHLPLLLNPKPVSADNGEPVFFCNSKILFAEMGLEASIAWPVYPLSLGRRARFQSGRLTAAGGTEGRESLESTFGLPYSEFFTDSRRHASRLGAEGGATELLSWHRRTNR